jgi:hypothetical protein
VNATLWALLSCLLAGIGARDQMLVAALTARLGRHGGLLLMGCITGALASGFAAWATQEIAGQMTYPARLVLACFALAAAGVESLVFQPKFKAKEPTRSLFAAAIVLLSQQAADAARFLVLAIALVTDAPVPAAVGGAMGTGGTLLLGWLAAGEMLDAQSGIVTIRRWAGTVLLGVGVGLGIWIFAEIGRY